MDGSMFSICFSLVFMAILLLLLEHLFFKLKDRVDDLEKQIANISHATAKFICEINKRYADLSTAFDCCDDNIDTLFDEKDKINESIADLKRSVECVNCKLQNPLTRFIK